MENIQKDNIKMGSMLINSCKSKWRGTLLHWYSNYFNFHVSDFTARKHLL